MGKELTAEERQARAKKRNRIWCGVSAVILLSWVVLFGSCCVKAYRDCTGELKTESDGTYRYYDMGKSYAIVDAEVKLPETVYVPAYYKEKPISSIRYEAHGFARPKRYGLSLLDVKKAYLPFGCELERGLGNLETLFIVNSDMEGLDTYLLHISNKKIVYIPKDVCYAWLSKHPALEIKKEGGSFIRNEITITCSNTVYMFNYEGAPNDGYFFINNFAYGGTIENTPYVPLRKGYTFGGWCKDPQCTQSWDFAHDTLPEAQYDEDGNEIFIETKLYAQWIKK